VTHGKRLNSSDFLRPIESRVLSEEWGTLTSHRFELRRRDGTWQEQIREVYVKGSGVGCLLYNPETGCVLLTRQFRLPALIEGQDPYLIEAPAGLLEGAHPEDRMRAELIEETGFEVSGLEHLYDLFMTPGAVNERISLFTGTYHMKDQVSDGGGEEHEGEDIEVLHVPLNEALNMIRTGEICDGKTVLLLQELALRQLKEAGE